MTPPKAQPNPGAVTSSGRAMAAPMPPMTPMAPAMPAYAVPPSVPAASVAAPTVPRAATPAYVRPATPGMMPRAATAPGRSGLPPPSVSREQGYRPRGVYSDDHTYHIPPSGPPADFLLRCMRIGEGTPCRQSAWR